MIVPILTVVGLAAGYHLLKHSLDLLSVTVRGDKMEVRFKMKDKDQFMETLRFIKKLPGAQFRGVGKDKYWLMDTKPTSIRKLEKRGFIVSGRRKIPKFDRDKFYLNPPWKNEKVIVPDKLWNMQKETVKFLHYRKGRGIVGHQMSLGKTVCSIAFVREDVLENLPALIICPANIKTQWAKEWMKWLNIPVHVIYGRKNYALPKNMSCIINYDILGDWKASLLKYGFKTMIPDEFHKCGNLQTIRTRAYRSLGRKIPNLIPLSGTPIRNKPSQFFPTLNLIDPEQFPSITTFRDRYSMFKSNGFSSVPVETSGCKNEGELQHILSKLMIRKERADKDVEEDLGIKGDRGKRIPVELKVSLEKYAKLERVAKERFKTATGLEKKDIIKNLTNSAFEAKKEQCLNWIADFLESGEKIVIFCYHRKVIDFICQAFPKEAVKIDGSVTGKRRDRAAEAFQGPKNLGVFQVDAMGEGIDWIAKCCSFGAFIELPHTSAVLEQAEMRFDRPGALSDTILYYYLLAKGTIDEKKMRNLDKGKKTFDKIVRGQSSTKQDDLLVGLFK